MSMLVLAAAAAGSFGRRACTHGHGAGVNENAAQPDNLLSPRRSLLPIKKRSKQAKKREPFRCSASFSSK